MNTLNLPYNLDRRKRLVIFTPNLIWQDSPVSQVMRKPLEREKEESGQVTSIVQYQAGAKFSQHPHPHGEEVFVLEGTFSDEHGTYPQSTYIRNPKNSVHSPLSVSGCTLLVKLNQFKQGDTKRVVIHTKDEPWRQGQSGLMVMPLHQFESEGTALVKWPKGEKFQPHTHWGGEEIFVLEGTFSDNNGDYPKGTWIRSPHMSSHHPFSKEGCIIFVKTGHM